MYNENSRVSNLRPRRTLSIVSVAICASLGGSTFATADITDQLDDGSAERFVILVAGTEPRPTLWLNVFEAQPGGEVISTISVTWGCLAPCFSEVLPHALRSTSVRAKHANPLLAARETRSVKCEAREAVIAPRRLTRSPASSCHGRVGRVRHRAGASIGCQTLCPKVWRHAPNHAGGAPDKSTPQPSRPKKPYLSRFPCRFPCPSWHGRVGRVRHRAGASIGCQTLCPKVWRHVYNHAARRAG